MDIRLGNSEDLLKTIDDNSVDLCLTDPPYFLDSLDNEWDVEAIKERKSDGVISSLPKGMKFDADQGKRFQEFYEPISKEIFRVLKPGGFFISFSAARLYHRMTIAIENSGFEIRDMIGWTYEGQAKAFSQDHIIDIQKNLSIEEKTHLKELCKGWKTPQLKPCIEPMCLAQKPTDLKLFENWIKFNVGLMDSTQTFGGKFPGNIISVPKPDKKEKGNFNFHVSVKPLLLIEHLIKLYTKPGAIILDPFLGSGTTAIAAIRTNRDFIGFEINPSYMDIINTRVNLEEQNSLNKLFDMQ